MAEGESAVLLKVQNLKKDFKVGSRAVLKALDDISFVVYEGETVSLVGEAGCGKSALGQVCIGISDRTNGYVTYRGKDVHLMPRRARRALKVQMVQQASVGPRKTVADVVGEGVNVGFRDKRAKRTLICQYLREVGLGEEYANQFAHACSDGQRQLIGIARALAMEPELMILDEPVASLDASTQAQIIELLIRLKKEKHLTYLLMTRDLAAVRQISDRMIVMCQGKIMEIADSAALYAGPLHPYTKYLMAPVSDIEAERQNRRQALGSQGSSTENSTEGCVFCGRCEYATEQCGLEAPEPREIQPGHFVACHYAEVES